MRPDWKPGDGARAPFTEHRTMGIASMDSSSVYKLLIGGIVPRPIAFVSTRSSDGRGNLAPFSFFMGVSSKPPAVAISITTKPDGSMKDTLRNILDTGEFVVNTVGEWMTEAMNHCSGEFPFGIDEREVAGLRALPSSAVGPPRVAESPVQYECRKLSTLAVGNGELGSAVIVVGEIVEIHVRADALDARGRLDIGKLNPVSRLGGLSYGLLGEVFDLARPPSK